MLYNFIYLHTYMYICVSAAAYLARAKEAKVTQAEAPYRFLCEQWVKHHADDELAQAMYKEEQASSRLLKDKGAGLSRDDIEALRRQT